MGNKININNYEAFLLDHMEGNLPEQDIALLKEFVLMHPELEINLEDTELVTIEIENISLGSKESLKKFAFSEEQFIAYVENTLTQKEKEKLELACSADVILAKELRLYKSTVLKPDSSVIFENKQSLKKQNKVIFFNARVYVSAAAALLLLFGLWFVLNNLNSGTKNNNTLSENKNALNTNTLTSVESNTISKQNITYTTDIVIEKQQALKNNIANNGTIVITNSFTVPLIVNNNTDTVKKDTEEKIVVVKKDSVINEIKIASNPPSLKNTYIVTEGTDDELTENTTPKEKTGFWNKASKALKNLNKLGVKKVDSKEVVADNNEQTVLSLGNFKIEKNRYNQE